MVRALPRGRLSIGALLVFGCPAEPAQPAQPAQSVEDPPRVAAQPPAPPTERPPAPEPSPIPFSFHNRCQTAQRYAIAARLEDVESGLGEP